MTKPTLQTVADLVGVSRSTASNAYSRPDQLSPAMREKILTAARSLGYPGPNPIARSLRSGRVGAVGVLMASPLAQAFTDPYAVLFMSGLAEAAEQNGSSLLLVPLSLDDGEAAIRAVRNASVDGFCVYCVPDWHPTLAVIQSRGLPVVSTEQRGDSGPETMFVGIDERAAAYSVATHVAALGHRRVAVLSDYVVADRRTGPVQVPSLDDVQYRATRQRLRGFRDAFAEVGIGWADITVVNAETNTRAGGAAAAASVLDRADRPTAVLACSDVLAFGVLDALTPRRLHPGRDVSVTGFDGVPESVDAGLTTVSQRAADRGRLAGELLLDPPSDESSRRIVLPTELVVRASTGPVRPWRDGAE
ncbi:MAG: hypothetical protein QG671_3197 [Actinomycetota bacterium]|nr:hypothetical protein [Actinomycetota bacterium]